MNTRFSVIIPTYDTPEFLIECLNSFNKFENIEILVGIDGCEKTKSVIGSLEKQNNVRFFYFTENSGPYNIKNNLIKESKSDVILFFDSDDVVSSDIFRKYDPKYDITRLTFEDFGGKRYNVELSQSVFFIKKIVLEQLSGFESWICNADEEFRKRAFYKNFKIKKDIQISFKRRIHTKNLTIKEGTNMISELRNSYVKKIEEKFKSKNWNNPEIKKLEYYEL